MNLVYSTVYCLTPYRLVQSAGSQVPQIARHFLGIWDDTVHQCQAYSSRVQGYALPQELLHCTLADLHGVHQEIDRMQAQAREAVYWPSIDADINDYVCLVHHLH